ncbi:MAG: M48 family metalloprotease [Firmicutes bacterium]|nr:M48 family metalloprotease [Bacillota bacterium]
MTLHSSMGSLGRGWRMVMALFVALSLLLAPVAAATRTALKPGWNLFSEEQDIQLGRQVAQDAERQLPMLNHDRVNGYLQQLGSRLAARAPFYPYPYTFKAVNDRSINAFALPGGPIYVHRGVIEAADNEAQLAGVLAHEIAHVALRHGTNQATKAYAWQLGLGLFGGVVGSDSIGAVLAQLGAGFAANSVLLKYSRDAERQADVLGTQILYDVGYDPRAMVQFFEKIEAERKGSGPPEFFSSHPKPENRAERVSEEIEKLGGLPRNYRRDSSEFQEVKRVVLSVPPPPKRAQPAAGAARPRSPEPPSARWVMFEHSLLRIRHPENWRVYGEDRDVALAPDGGIVQARNGNSAVAYGVLLGVFTPRPDRRGRYTLEDATEQLYAALRQSNPELRIVRRARSVRVDGRAGLSTLLENASPVGGRESDWLVTVLRDRELVYFLGVAPESAYRQYEPAFEQMLSSIRFR